MCSSLFASIAARKKRIRTRQAANQHTLSRRDEHYLRQGPYIEPTIGNTPSVARFWLVEYAEWSKFRIARAAVRTLQDDTQAGCPTWARPSCNMIVAL